MLTPVELLRQWLTRQAGATSCSWLDEQDQKLPQSNSDQALYLAISLVPRKLGKADLELTDEDLRAADAARPGWNPRGWSLDQVGRLYFLLAYGGGGELFAKRLGQLLTTADVAEEITFLRGLPLYPDQQMHEGVARKGCRTNMQPVFEAVAHNNPYPREQFDDNAWNHLVLKALFVNSTLYPIQGFDERANPELARIMCDYAHERWAAGRPITPEIWRGVGPFASGDAIDDLKKVLASDRPFERWAGVLALQASGDPQAASVLAASDVSKPDDVNWDNLLQRSEAA